MGLFLLWSRNLAVQAIARVILARRGLRPQVVESPAALRQAAAGQRPWAILTTDEDLDASVWDLSSLVRWSPEPCRWIVCSRRRPLPSAPSPGIRVIPLPFSAGDLLDALPPTSTPAPAPKEQPPAPPGREGPPPPPPLDSGEELRRLIEQEVHRLLETTLREWVQRAVQEVVPELAESLIRQELDRLLREVEEIALQGPPSPDSEQPPASRR